MTPADDSPIRVEVYDASQVIYVALIPDGHHHHADFPHPLIAVDYDETNRMIGFGGSGRMAKAALRAWLEWDETEPSDLLTDKFAAL